MLSKKCTYGLRALIYIASLKETEYVSVQKVSEALNIPFYFLSKIFLTLTKKGFVRSSRGPTGGVALAQPGDTISLYDIVEALDESNVFVNCILGLERCNAQHPCPLHDQAVIMRKRLKAVLETSTVEEVSNDVGLLNLRLK